MRAVLCCVFSRFSFLTLIFPNMCYVVVVKLRIETEIINTIVKIWMAMATN